MSIKSQVHEGWKLLPQCFDDGGLSGGVDRTEHRSPRAPAARWAALVIVHARNGEVLDVQRKARKKEVPDEQVTWKIRNLAGGFIFARGDCNPEEGVKEQAVKAVDALGLDFGAVDIIYTKKKEVLVLEVNTACGLVGTTLDKYVEAFNDL